MDFSGQVAVITGGAQGIGRAVAEVLRAAGARIVIWDMDEALSRQTAEALGGETLVQQVDVGDWASVEAAASATLEAAGRIDVLVNSAGVAGLNAPVVDYPVEEFERIVTINLNGTFFTNRAVVPAMQRQGYGRIVNIASIAGKEGNPNASAYSASKAGVIGFTKSLGKELAEQDISVNCVTPAAARTRIFDQMAPKFIEFMLSKIPRGRFLEVDEAANMIAFVASRENGFATGAVFDLSGGRATY
jgi:3-oxoacyl-[acyl-carrier protein] reductase